MFIQDFHSNETLYIFPQLPPRLLIFALCLAHLFRCFDATVNTTRRWWLIAANLNLPLGTPGGSDGARKPASSEEAYPADPKELPEWRNSCGTAGGATFLAVAAGFGGRDMPPTAKETSFLDQHWPRQQHQFFAAPANNHLHINKPTWYYYVADFYKCLRLPLTRKKNRSTNA